MDTLKELVDALILLTQSALVLRFIICCIKETDQEDQPQMYKKQKRTALIAFLLILCIYDIPKMLEQYMGVTGW